MFEPADLLGPLCELQRKLEERGESRGNSRGGSIAERREPEKAGLDGDEAPSQSDSVTASDTEAVSGRCGGRC